MGERTDRRERDRKRGERILSRVMRRNAGGPGMLPYLFVALALLWLAVGGTSLVHAPIKAGGLAMVFLGSVFMAVAVMLVRRGRDGTARDRLLSLCRETRPGAEEMVTEVVEEVRHDGKGNRIPALRVHASTGETWVLYPTARELRLLRDFFR